MSMLTRKVGVDRSGGWDGGGNEDGYEEQDTGLVFPPPLTPTPPHPTPPKNNGLKPQSPAEVVLWTQCLCPSKIHVEALIPVVMIFGGGPSRGS